MKTELKKTINFKFKCAFCKSEHLTEVLNLGDVALAGGFLKSSQFNDEPKFSLRVHFCNDCLAVQVVDIIDPNLMFGDYFYFSSQIKTLRDHFEDYATEVVSRFLQPDKSTVLEFGCNDGVLMRPMANQGIRTLIGVDPASNIISTINDERINIINDFFTEETAQLVLKKFGHVDMVVANNVFAHIPDICGVTRAIKDVMSKDGVFIFEVHYLGKIIQGMQYDMIYHEHLYYYSLIALENHFKNHGMVIFDIKPIPIHGGSMRYYVCKKESKYANQTTSRVRNLRQEELEIGYDKPETYKDFANKAQESRKKLVGILEDLVNKGRTVAGYGASGRANTIIQYCDISNKYLEYMIDDAPAKTGFYTPGSHLEIFSNEVLKTNPPDYLLIFAWSFINEIAAKCETYMRNGGRLIVPLPEVRIIMSPYSKDIL
jgi:SAM-dependent methyltransferase